MENLQEKKKKRVNVRLNDEQIASIDKICDDKKIKSRSKVLKSALELVTKGTSDIDFEIVADHSKEPRKTILFEDDKKIRGNCPHCKGKTSLDPEHYKKFNKVVQQNFIPKFRCKNEECNEIHSNDNYSIRPIGICSRCYQFSNKNSGSCPWCSFSDAIIPISDSKLTQMNIPYPNV